MITSNGRGVIAGGEEANKQKRNLPAEEIRNIARRVHTSMSAAGYAHIDPEASFVEGFLIGFSNARYFTVHVAS